MVCFTVRARHPLVLVFVLVLFARAAIAADWYLDVQPADAGGAWLLVEASSHRTVRHVTRGGAQTDVVVPGQAAIRAIASSAFDGSLWVATTDGIMQRTAGGEWRTIAMPHFDHFARWFGTTGDVLAPIGRDRVVLMRGCDYDCTDVTTADAVAGTLETTRLAAQVGPAVTDGRGGLWAVVRKSSGHAPMGYAHLDDRAWRIWTDVDKKLEGFAAQYNTAQLPAAIVPDGHGGAIGATREDLVAIDPTGEVRRLGAISRNHESHCDDTLGLAINDAGELDEIDGVHFYADRDDLDTSPVVRHFSQGREKAVRRAPTSIAWRAANENGTPDVRVARSGDTLWIAAGTAVFSLTGRSWHVIGGGRGAALQKLVSVPMQIGSLRADAGNAAAIGLRPELMFAPNRSRPSRALGVYLELATANIQPARATFLGGGLTYASYSHGFGAALSAGCDAAITHGEAHPQLVFSGFLGIRGVSNLQVPPFEMPIRLRLDVRPATSDVPGTAMVSLSIDTIGVGLLFYGGAGALTTPQH
jgi:hypothetical protein